MKKTFAILLTLSLAFGTIAYASPAWLSDETIEVLSNVPGFDYAYDDMYDRMTVSPTDVLAAYQSGDGILNPRIEGYGSDMLVYAMVFTSESKYYESITGIIILVDGVRYIFEIPADQLSGQFTMVPVGETAATMIKAIIASSNPVKVRCEYNSGNVDFEMTDFQIAGLKNLYAAYEAVGGPDQEFFSMAEFLQPVIVR